MSVPASSKRERAIIELRTRLRQITVENGFNTDAGLHVLLMETPTFGPSDPPAAIVLTVPEDDPRSHQQEYVITSVPFSVQAVVPVEIEGRIDWEPWLSIEAIIADIKRAVELPDRTLAGSLIPNGLTRGSTRALDREAGSETVGASIEYRATFGEKWGSP